MRQDEVMRHELKTHPEPFVATMAGRKPYEVRRADRAFGVGDELILREWTAAGGYTGRSIRAGILYVTEPNTWGLPPDLCVLGIRVLEVRA